ncbi:YbiR family transporter [Cuneatibacter caecimuris]|uniref:YbiR family transporter n=2 Tax=Cuneatibacter caecimuris TaxID=1796618 RepID=A0A4Q7P310_9FIRM|nr:YbiR family transporter [Cuneatibacter caecimuris]
MMKRMINWLKGEIVLAAAWLLALISLLIVPPDREYLNYIDFRTLGLLFSLMAVMAGARRLGVFRQAGLWLLEKVKNSRQLEAVLVLLCFFSSMAVTNDVALITFVPFALEVLRMAKEERRAVRVVILQTLAANLGSMATPIGNPQNLYLYGISGYSAGDFLMLMLPLTALSLGLLAACLLLTQRQKMEFKNAGEVPGKRENGKKLGYLLLFILCLGAVAKWIPVSALCGAVALYVLLADRKTLAAVDYSLLLTFIGFFIFIGNMGRVPAFAEFLQRCVEGREVGVAVLASQAISNVPAALLLSGFTDSWGRLIVGANLGGLGTLIASMASLISYKILAEQFPHKKREYLIKFTGYNLAFLAVLMTGNWLLGG